MRVVMGEVVSLEKGWKTVGMMIGGERVEREKGLVGFTKTMKVEVTVMMGGTNPRFPTPRWGGWSF